MRCDSRCLTSQVQCEKPAGHVDHHVHGIAETGAPGITVWGVTRGRE